MNENEKLLVALYKARQQQLKQIEEVEGPLSEFQTQNEISVSIGEANSFLGMTTEDLNQEVRRFPTLFDRGWVVPHGSRCTEGLYAMVIFTPFGVSEAERLLAAGSESSQ